MKKRLLSILLTACLLVGLLPTVALAEDGVSYLDAAGKTQTCTTATEVTSGTTTWNGGWYVVTGNNVTIGSDVTVNGDVRLILTDGCTLTVTQDINGGSLTIYGQANGTGKLVVTGSITGGVGSPGGNGVGPGGAGGNGGNGGGISITGGTVEAGSITGGSGGNGGNGVQYGNGIGGVGGNGGGVSITGGTVMAVSITGGGVSITGGTVKATGSITGGNGGSGGSGGTSGDGAGGYGGNGGTGGCISITGGMVMATGSITGGVGGTGGTGVYSDIYGKNLNGDNGGNGGVSIIGGVVFQGNSGAVYGDQTLTGDLTIPSGKTLTIDSGKTLTIPEGVTLTIENGGTLTNNGTIINYGTIVGTVLNHAPKNVVSANYLDENGDSQTCTSATEVSSSDTEWTTGWYVVRGTVEISSRVTVSGAVHLILADGCNLTVTGGIRVEDYDNNPDTPSPNALTIYAQSVPVLETDGTPAATNTAGKLTANGGPYDYAGIGGNGYGSNITINGGIVTATGGWPGGAGIGSGGRRSSSNITINGGAVIATGNEGGAGIGGGAFGDGSNITISGGTVRATGNEGGAGIGGGEGGSGSNITISGGTVIANGRGGGAGIGSGCGERGSGSNITISGGTVTATGGSTSVGVGGAGIGGGGFGSGSNITISGGNVTAIGTEGGAGIGGGDAVVRGAVRGLGSNITISGGTVTATGNEGGAGIGGGAFGDGSNITISGGTVTATNTGGGVGIGCGDGGDSGTFQTNDGNAVLFASTIGDQSGKDSWSGVIFEGNDGKVYGTSVTPIEDFTIDSDKNLLIPENAELTITNITATNSGNVYVDGVLSGTVSGSGGVYYPLTVTGGTAGEQNTSTVGNKTYGKAGSEITLTPVTPTGYQFKSWTVSGADVTVENNKFTMPASAVTVAAEFVYTPPVIPTYPPIILDTENGIVTVSPTNPVAGDKVTITPKPDESYVVDQVIVTDASGNSVAVTDNGDGTYSFTQPAGKVTIKVVFRDATVVPFVDVPADAYYYNAVQWAVRHGITNGTSATTFSPNDPCTRAQMVTFLWRAAGYPTPQGSEMPFKDVVKGSYYETAVQWAVENGITYGTSATTFAPDATCDRAQFATFLWRSQGKPAAGTTNPFTDVAEGTYYTDAVLWAAENGITEGTSSTTFSPYDNCTRAQTVTFLYRCLGR